MRIAIITAYYDEDRATIERCIESMRRIRSPSRPNRAWAIAACGRPCTAPQARNHRPCRDFGVHREKASAWRAGLTDARRAEIQATLGMQISLE